MKSNKHVGSKKRKKIFLSLVFYVFLIGIALRNYLLLGEMDFGQETLTTYHGDAKTWCEHVRKARHETTKTLRVSYPCERFKFAESAIICMLTDGTTEKKASRVVFTARNYINGAMALGASLAGKFDSSLTHQLLLIREGFELETDDLIRLEAVGWTIGIAPNFPLEKKYIPRFPRYKTTYTKVTAIGLSEYKCVLLMDADTLATGDLREILKCDSVFKNPSNKVAGVIDWYRMRWKLFNTGCILWKTSIEELERLFNLTKDTSFMKRYSSDQDFLNNVYPDRLTNNTLNNEIVASDNVESRSSEEYNRGVRIRKLDPVIPNSLARAGAVVPLSWDYNAQTHAEVQNNEFWNEHRSTTKILHFTEKKGWQCEPRYDPIPVEKMPHNCKTNKKEKWDPLCFCSEAHLYWIALRTAEKRFATKFLTVSNKSFTKGTALITL